MGSMRYFSAGALFTLVLLTECFGANDRSRQRSGPIRSVPVAADIKREANFDCPEEFGYYPHPTDCTLYYVCVFGGALLESCTGGLMYSHELQTCDWPRNVGCDATGAVVAEDLERLNEREPPPPPPRRNPPPAPRLQPKPVITSRGQPHYSRREEYEKQQQLYAEVDDLPPVEELETDRQQRVYRGQPSTIGQVQKDRDGYVSQPISSGRTLNANIIPASLNQNSKIGSFSFGSQVDERRTATATQAPQTYSGQKDDVTDIPDRLVDISTNEIEIDGASFKTHQRAKRSTAPLDFNFDSKNQTQITKRNDDDQVMEYFEAETEPSLNDYDDDHDETERDKRQVRYYLKNGYKTPVKIWPNTKQLKLVDLQHYNPNIQSTRYQTQYNNDNLNSATRQQSPQSYFQNPYLTYHTDNFQSQQPFKPSIPDIVHQKPTNINTQIITKSPPISSLNNDNPFASLSGGFYNNNQNKVTHNNQNMQYSFQPVTPKYVSFPDSSQLPTTVVTGKPVHGNPTSSPNNYNSNYQVPNKQPSKFHNTNDLNRKPNNAKPIDVDEEYEDEDSEEGDDEESSEEFQNGDNFKPFSTRLPHEYTHPKNKYAHIDNPFANPNFDFDEFLSNLRENHYSAIGVTTSKPKPVPEMTFNLQTPKVYSSTPSYDKKVTNPTGFGSTGVSSPKPFTIPGVISNSANLHNVQHVQSNVDSYNNSPQVFKGQTGLVASKFKPPNFKDDRQLPLQYNFNTQFENNNNNNQTRLTTPNSFSQYLHEVTPKPFNANTRFNSVTSSTNAYRQGNSMSSERPFVTSTIKPDNAYIVTFQQSTVKPSLANNQLAALQNHWKHSSDLSAIMKSTLRPNYFSDIPNLEELFKQAIHPSSQAPIKSPESVRHYMTTTSTTTTQPPLKRKPIPKPSPEMSDYYYDDEDDQYYYEPMVKPKYMPSTEVKPQRPPMAQNYHEYDDSSENTGDSKNIKGNSLAPRRPTNPNSLSDSVTKNHNDVAVVTKVPFKQSLKNINGKIPVPVMGYVSPDVTHQELNELSMVHHLRNRTYHMRVPNGNDPYTLKPPKYLNQTTLRPYTLRHRLAKPTTVKDSATQSEENKQMRGRIRHHNIVAQMKLTTPSDSSKQETRNTKTSHDDKTNSLEPTERIPSSSFSASPRPKMLYNGSQAYSPDQYDPYYAVYDEDGELYKDTDYVQQYNVGSLRPAVQQTYRGTPPPARRPVETYTPRPVLPDDYEDALIQGEIPNQNQYQPAIRQQTRPSNTRGRGSAHYSTQGGSDSPQQSPNRGTPPTRSRPTLKPSTAIVSKTAEAPDIYAIPPSRPAPVYPQPLPDKTAAKCRKDVCLLPDCFCGGKDIPGDLPVESVPQIVVLTFDDSVNDLNKGLYADLFEKGRVNPNGCPISATFYVSHEWTDYSQVQNLYSAGHEMASHTVSHSFGEQFSQKKWNREVGGQREILAAYGGVKLEDVRGMRAPFLSVGGNKMFKMLYDSNFTYDSSLPVYENKPPSWPYTLDYKLFHDCMIPPCPTKSYPGVWEVPMVMWQDLNGGRCSMGDACANPSEAEGVYKMILKNFDRHYTSNRAPFGLFYHAAWFTQAHHKEGFIMFLDFINKMKDVWIVTNWQALQWVRDPTPISRLNSFQPFQCNYQGRPKKCNNPKVCNLWHKSGVRYMRTCQPCPEIYPWTGKTGIRSSRIDNEIEEK